MKEYEICLYLFFETSFKGFVKESSPFEFYVKLHKGKTKGIW